MPRRVDHPARLAEIIAAATAVFGAKGFRATQMADIAAAMSVSPALLYSYVDGKEALFSLAVDGVLGDTPAAPTQLPVTAPPFETTLARVREQIARVAAFPRLEAAIRRRRVTDPAGELTEIISELYDLTLATREAADLAERSARDLPELAAIFFGELREPLLQRLQRFLERRIRGGHLQPVPDAAVGARMILETVTWFGRHRFTDGKIDPGFDPEVTRDTVVLLLRRAFAGS